MEDDTEIKQNYLCEEIMDKGYSPDEFIEFIQKLKGENASLESFSLWELKDVVAKFKNLMNPNQQNNNPFDDNNNEGDEARNSNPQENEESTDSNNSHGHGVNQKETNVKILFYFFCFILSYLTGRIL